MSSHEGSEPFDWRKLQEPERKLTFVDAVTGEWLEFAGEGWPTTDEEAELILPRPPTFSLAALNVYYNFREDGQSIKEALLSVMEAMHRNMPKG